MCERRELDIRFGGFCLLGFLGRGDKGLRFYVFILNLLFFLVSFLDMLYCGNISVISIPFFRPEWEGFEEFGLVNDAFVAYVAAGVEAWGKPFDIVIDRYAHVAWKYPQNVIAELTRYERFVDLSFYTPQGIMVY